MFIFHAQSCLYIAILNPYIYPRELCMFHSLKKVEPFDLYYIQLVSVPTKLAVASPHWQLASIQLYIYTMAG